MCAALFTIQVKFSEKTYRMTHCDMNELYQVSFHSIGGTAVGKMKQKSSFNSRKCLKSIKHWVSLLISAIEFI